MVLAIDLVESLGGEGSPFAIEVVAFSEEEGVRFGVPFHWQPRADLERGCDMLARRDAAGISVEEAIHGFGLDPVNLPEASWTMPYSLIWNSTLSKVRCWSR